MSNVHFDRAMRYLASKKNMDSSDIVISADTEAQISRRSAKLGPKAQNLIWLAPEVPIFVRVLGTTCLKQALS